MKLNVQKRIAADVMKCSPKRVVFDSAKLKEIKEAITKSDMRGLIIDKFVAKKRKKGISNARSSKIRKQKVKGLRKGHGSRKGKKTARTPKKISWMNRVRLQRKVLKSLKEKKLIDNGIYWDIYKKIKGGFFRSKRHLQLYLAEKKLTKVSPAADDSKKNQREKAKSAPAKKELAKAGKESKK